MKPLTYCVIAVRPNGSHLSLGLFKDFKTACAVRDRYAATLKRIDQPECKYYIWRAEWYDARIMEKRA